MNNKDITEKNIRFMSIVDEKLEEGFLITQHSNGFEIIIINIIENLLEIKTKLNLYNLII